MKYHFDDKEAFSEFFKKIDENRLSSLKKSADTELKKSLLRDGIAVAKKLFSENDLKELINFQSKIETILGNSLDCSGYISFSQIEGKFYPRLDRSLPNHGQCRLQTKSIKFQLPGFSTLAEHKSLKDIFSWWYNVDNVNITRGTLEWIIPAPLNHSPWHKDIVRPQLKAFILLGNVDLETAPMYYAKGSHLLSNDFEKEVSYRLFKDGTSTISNYLPRRGNHLPAKIGAHSGYLSDDEAKNDYEKIDNCPIVTLGGIEYEKFVCTGEPGDVIFFESNGFHAGNISYGKIRRTIALSSPDARSDISVTFNQKGYTGV